MLEFGKKRDLASALTVFEASKQNQGGPNTYAYRTIIDVCGLCGDPMKSRSIYEKVGVTADLASYNILLKSCCLAARVNLALHIYREVKHLESTGDLKLDVFTYCTVVKVLADARMWKTALEIKEDMVLAGVTPNTITWSSLISACANATNAEEAIQLIEEMLEAGCEPNSQCCNILLHACVEARQYDRAFRLFRFWKEHGIQKSMSKDLTWKKRNHINVDHKYESLNIISDSSTSSSQCLSSLLRFPFAPSTSTYNILMKACGTDYHHAKALIDEMRTEGLSPNHISWSILIDICGLSGNVQAALQVSYNTLLRARSQYDSLEEAQQCLSIYQDMRKAGYRPNDYYLKLLMEEWCEGVIQNRSQNTAKFTASDAAALGPPSLLLEKVAEHLEDSNAESLSIDLRGLTRVEARIMVLAVLRMIKEKYAPGDIVEDDLWIITEDEISGGVTDSMAKLLQYDLGFEVLSAESRDVRNQGSGFEILSVSYPKSKEIIGRNDRPLKSKFPSRRPAVLQRLKVTKASLHHWLQ